MAERDFYNLNLRIAYPLVHGDPTAFLTGGSLSAGALVDAGFVMGRLSGFSPGTDSVYLHSVVVSAGSVFFDFRSGASGFSSWRLFFQIPVGTPFGATCYVDATPIAGGSPDPDYGSGFVTAGDLSQFAADGLYQIDGTLRVEPALVQSEVDSYVSDVSVGNKARCCPTPCGVSPDPCDASLVHLFSSGLEGDILFKEGNNVTVQVDEEDNAILFDALTGYGEGESCDDVIVDGAGEAGFHRGEFCLPCGAVIRSVNGRVVPSGKLVISGWPGVEISTDPGNHEVRIKLDSEKFCEV